MALPRIRVLLVDDHEVVRAGLRAMLSSDGGIEVVAETATGARAIGLVRELRPEIVLLDIRLPDMDGAEVCKRIKSEVPEVVVAMLTTFADDELVRKSIRAGADGYLLKDVERLDLSRTIRSLARGEPVIDPKVAPQVLAAIRADPGDTNRSSLNERQREVLRLVAEGLSNREIGERTHLSELTIKSYMEDILQQLGARNRVHAAVLATKQGLI